MPFPPLPARYAIVAEIGRGAWGVVYRAVDETLNRTVAIKWVAGMQRGRDHVLSEIRAAAALAHPNAVGIFDVQEAGDAFFLVMEYVAGATLRARMDAHEHPPILQRIAWIVTIAQALGAAHSQGLVHGDVKPENVMVREDGVVKVLDFALARAMQTSVDVSAETVSQGFEGGALAPPSKYVAPEVVRGDAVDARADQFAWAVLAMDLLGSAEMVSPAAQTMGARPPQTPMTADVPADVMAVLARASAADPADRFASMEAAIRGLENRPASRLKRRRAPWVLGGAALLAATAFLAARPRPKVASAPVMTPKVEDAGPSVMSPNHEATAAYQAAMQAIHDASRDAALMNLARATELDPAFAAAHLRYVATAPTADDDVREHARLAFARRADLSAHDRVLLDAYRAWTGIPQDTAATERALAEALIANPGNADYAHNLCRVRMLIGEYRKGVEACEVAIRVDPQFADAYRYKGYNLLLLDERASAESEYRTCLSVSPAATSCLRDLYELKFGTGQCEDAVDLARRLIALDPKNPTWSRLLAFGLYATDASPESVLGAFERSWQLRSESRRARFELSDRVGLAIAAGRFDEAEATLEAFNNSIVDLAEEDLHLEAADRLIELYLEEGRNREAEKIAEAYERQRTAWTPVKHFDASIIAPVWMYRAGSLSRIEFAAIRSRWLVSERSRPLTLGQFGSPEGYRWILAYATPSITPDDAREAVAVLPSFLPLPNSLLRLAAEESIGRTFLFANRSSEAIPHLTAAAKSCSAVVFPFAPPRALFELGAALEVEQHRQAACEAYKREVSRWPLATTHSITTKRASTAIERLGCGRASRLP